MDEVESERPGPTTAHQRPRRRWRNSAVPTKSNGTRKIRLRSSTRVAKARRNQTALTAVYMPKKTMVLTVTIVSAIYARVDGGSSFGRTSEARPATSGTTPRPIAERLRREPEVDQAILEEGRRRRTTSVDLCEAMLATTARPGQCDCADPVPARVQVRRNDVTRPDRHMSASMDRSRGRRRASSVDPCQHSEQAARRREQEPPLRRPRNEARDQENASVRPDTRSVP